MLGVIFVFFQDLEALRNHLNIPIFLTKIIIKTTDVFYEQINNFLPELLMFYVRVLRSVLLHLTANFLLFSCFGLILKIIRIIINISNYQIFFFSFTPGYSAYRLFSTEALLIIETELFQILDEFLQHLFMEQSIFKVNFKLYYSI